MKETQKEKSGVDMRKQAEAIIASEVLEPPWRGMGSTRVREFDSMLSK
jgi:hypothetical protein